MNQTYKKILDIPYIPRIIKIMIIMGINWTFQSLLYMDKTEKIFKLLIELILFLVLFIILTPFFTFTVKVIISLVLAHTINWMINGHIYALLKTFGTIKTSPDKFIGYLHNLEDRSSKEKSIVLVATFGSISREELKDTSDLDVRIIRKNGILNGLRACIFTTNERTKAFFNKFPLDIYLLDNIEKMYDLREDPIIIHSKID